MFTQHTIRHLQELYLYSLNSVKLQSLMLCIMLSLARLHRKDYPPDPLLPASQWPMGHLHVPAQPDHRPRPAAGVWWREGERGGERAQKTPPQGSWRQIQSRWINRLENVLFVCPTDGKDLVCWSLKSITASQGHQSIYRLMCNMSCACTLVLWCSYNDFKPETHL